MTNGFYNFKMNIMEAIENGWIKTSKPLTETDLAIQYAIGKEMEETKEHFFTADDIIELIRKHCGQDVYDRVFPKEER